jgi:uncharacterized protein with HEPN domain
VKKDPRVYLAQILERIERIQKFTVGGQDIFLADPLIQDAVIRNFEVIGEAAKRVPEDYRQRHPDIPWRHLAAFRDVLIHQYEGVSLPEVWQVIAEHLPRVDTALRELVPSLEALEQELAETEDADDSRT